MCRKPDSLVTFYLLYFYIYGVLFSYYYYYYLLFSKTRQHLRCYLLFGLIGHFGLLQDVNISSFLSFFLYFSVLLDNKYPYIPNLDQPLISDTMLEILRID